MALGLILSAPLQGVLEAFVRKRKVKLEKLLTATRGLDSCFYKIPLNCSGNFCEMHGYFAAKSQTPKICGILQG